MTLIQYRESNEYKFRFTDFDITYVFSNGNMVAMCLYHSRCTVIKDVTNEIHNII